MLIKNISNIVNNKIDCNMLNNSNYISTENMLENFGGIKEASNVPSGKCTAILKKDILLSNIRPYFKKLWYSKFNGGCSNDVIALRVNNKLAISKYVFYALSSNKFFDVYVANCKGTKMPRGNKDVLLNYDIPTKSLSEQQHIVDTIGSVDNLIEKYEDLYLKIQEFLILKYTQLQSQEGLKVVDIFKCFNGGTFKSADYVETSNKKLVTIKNIDATGFNLQDITYLKDNLDCEKYALKYGDILLTMTGAYLGRCGIVSEKNCYQNQRILKVIGESKAFTYVFLKVNEKAIFSLGKGSAQPNLSLQDFYQMKVPYSALDIKQFKQYDNLFDMMLNIKLKQQKAKHQKQKLLQKYFG